MAFHTQLVRPGFAGIAVVGSQSIRCSAFSINPNQDTLFYNHVIGLNDTVPTGTGTKGESVGTIQPQRLIWRPSPISINGGFSYPACFTSGTAGNISDLFNHAKKGTYFDMEYSFYCNKKRKFTDCRINTWTLSLTQGDIVEISTDIYAKKVEAVDASTDYTTEEKFLTWDKVSFDVSGITERVQAFELTINNGAKNIYTNNTSGDLYPHDIRLGMQEVTGSVTYYLKQAELFLDKSTGTKTITIVMPSLTITVDAVLRNDQVEGHVGPIVTTIPFVGVGKALGT